MVHELMLDENFALSTEGLEAGLSGHGVDLEEFALALERNEFAPLLSIVDTVRARLAALTPNRKDLARALDERLDTALLAQELSAGAFTVGDLYSLIKFMGERLLALQAPARQAATEAWLVELHDAASASQVRWTRLAPRAFDHVLRELAFIDIDMANYHLSVLSQHLIGSKGIEYLRTKFEARWGSGEYQRSSQGFPARTEAWLLAARDSLSSSTVPGAHQLGAGASDCVAEALVSSIFHNPSDDEAAFSRELPETLREHDAERLTVARRQLASFAVLAVLNIVMTQVLRVHESISMPPASAELKRAQDKLYGLVHDETQALRSYEDLTADVVAVTAELVEAVRGGNGAELSPEGRATLEALLRQAASGTLSNTVQRQFAAVVRKSLKDPAHSSEQLLKKISLAPWRTEINDACDVLRKVFDLNLKVHGTVYGAILGGARSG